MTASDIYAAAALAGALVTAAWNAFGHAPRIKTLEDRLTAIYDKRTTPAQRAEIDAIIAAVKPAAEAAAQAKGTALEHELLSAAVAEGAKRGLALDANALVAAVKQGAGEGVQAAVVGAATRAAADVAASAHGAAPKGTVSTVNLPYITTGTSTANQGASTTKPPA